ncbi:MAG: hypothetical protein H6708_34705 [Kofleriaceae bacterium]|nr:hypothetical protein [Myxococcales bacterium]MCB9565566.1 hypothetical protein [Kofleriaceae bacterium]
MCPADPPDDTEPKVRDLLRRDDAAQPDAIDPLTMARLADWFEVPSFAQLAEQGLAAMAPPPDAERPEASAASEIQARRREALRHVDPAMVARLTRHEDLADAVRPAPPPTSAAERPILCFDETRVPPALDLDDLPEVQRSVELERDLEACTPQAFLRDLHRPEKDFYIHYESPFEIDPDDVTWLADPVADIRRTIRTDYRSRGVAPAGSTMSSDLAALQQLLARPWSEGKRERARQREAELLAAEAAAAGKDAAADAVPRGPEEAS